MEIDENLGSELGLQTILDHSSAVIFIKDLKGRHLLVNKLFLEVLGLDRDDVVGKTTHEIFPEEFASNLTSDDDAVLTSKKPLQKEESIPTGDGLRHYFIVKFALFDKNNEPWAICGISTDITRQKLSESILRASEEKFRNLFELSPVGVALWETDGYLVEANKVYLDTLGYSESEVLSINYSDITSNSNNKNSTDELLQLADSPDKKSLETTYTRKNGIEIPVEIFAHHLSSDRGKQRIWSILIDQSASKQAEKEIQNKNASFEAIFRKNPEPLFITRVDSGLIVDANDSFLKVSGYSYDEVVGHSTLELNLWKHESDRQKMIDELRTRGSVKGMEVEGFTSTGETRIFDISSDIITIDGEQVLLTSAEDITEKRHYESALTRIAGAIAYDPKENLLEKITRYFAETMEADIAFVGVLSESDTSRKIKTLEVLIDGQRADKFEYNLSHSPCETVIGSEQCIYPENIQALFPRDIMLQELRIEAYLGAPLLDSNGQTMGIIVALFRHRIDEAKMISKLLSIFSSVAAGEIERLSVQEEQLKLEKHLQVKQKMELVGRLSAGIAHDFNNILASIMGYSDLASMLIDDKQAKLKRFLGEINKAGSRARDLVEKLLIFSRRDSGDPVVVDINKVISETVDILGSTTPAAISINTSSSLDKDHNSIFIDPIQFQQVIINLIINARDAIKDKGKIEISCSLQQLSKHSVCDSCDENFDGEFITISIRDSGEGINMEVGSGLFTPFYSTRKLGEATGMGLSVVHGIVHSHNGHVSLQSNAEGGTEISLYFPQAKQEQAEVDVTTGLQNKPSKTINGKRILVVDDEEPIAGFFQTLLEDKGYDIITTTDSENALNIIREESDTLALIITDQVMPRVTGLQIAHEAKKKQPALPVFLCSGYNDVLGDTPLSEFGLDASFTKPVDSDQLLEKINQFLPANSVPGQ